MDDKKLVDGSFRFVDVKTSGKGGLIVDYRLMSPGLFVGTVRFRFTHTLTVGKKTKQLSDETIEPDRIHDDPFVWRARRNVTGGATTLRVRVTVDGTPKLDDLIDLSSKAVAEAAKVQRAATRLVLAINDTPRTFPLLGNIPEAEKVTRMMVRIATLLRRGLDDTAWLGPSSGRGLTLQELELSDSAEKDERWARRISEMMLLAPYFLSSTVYRLSSKGFDDPMYDFMGERLKAGQESFYPVAVQCQQLCTTILMSHGVPRNLLGAGINAGGSEGLAVFKAAAGGAFFTKDEMRNADKGLAASPPVGKCSVYQWNKPGGANQGKAHIGAVIRVQNSSWKMLQTFDTGGLNAPTRGDGVKLTAVQKGELGGGIFDDPWTQRIAGSGDPFSGVGIIGAQHRPPANLSQWWPAGFVRLIVRRRADKAVVYATPLLRMHDATRDYPYAVLANALRGAPAVDEFEPIWQISAPRLIKAVSKGEPALAEIMMTSPRNTRAKDILSQAGVDPKKPLRDNFRNLFLLCEIRAKEDGLVVKNDLPKGEETGSTQADTRPWGVRTGELIGAINLSRVPTYFRGDE